MNEILYQGGSMKALPNLAVDLFLSVTGGLQWESGMGIARCLGSRITPEKFGGLFVTVLLVFSGCGGSYYSYSKPGTSQQQMLQDGFECKQASRQSFVVGSGGTLVGGTEANKGIWIECLQARGYTVTEESEDQREQAQANSERVRQLRQVIEEGERARQREAQWLQAEYKWLLVEGEKINETAAALNSDRTNTPQRRDAVAAHEKRLEEFNRRQVVYEQRRTASSSVAK
jgi:hypothetical protein